MIISKLFGVVDEPGKVRGWNRKWQLSSKKSFQSFWLNSIKKPQPKKTKSIPAKQTTPPWSSAEMPNIPCFGYSQPRYSNLYLLCAYTGNRKISLPSFSRRVFLAHTVLPLLWSKAWQKTWTDRLSTLININWGARHKTLRRFIKRKLSL